MFRRDKHAAKQQPTSASVVAREDIASGGAQDYGDCCLAIEGEAIGAG
jgi:hypothetical protein